MKTNKILSSYKELHVWQRAMELVVSVYKVTVNFPKEKIYGLTSQIRRSAISIPSNIAEGRMRGTRKDFVQFLRIAYASGAELETQIEISKQLPRTNMLDYSKVDSLLNEIMKMLNVMIRKLNPNAANKLSATS